MNQKITYLFSFFLVLGFCLSFLYVSYAGSQNFTDTVGYSRSEYPCGSEYISYTQHTDPTIYDGFFTFYGLSQVPTDFVCTAGTNLVYTITDYDGFSDVLQIHDGSSSLGTHVRLNYTLQLDSYYDWWIVFFWWRVDYTTHQSYFQLINASGDVFLYMYFAAGVGIRVGNAVGGFEDLNFQPTNAKWVWYELILLPDHWTGYFAYNTTDIYSFEQIFSTTAQGSDLAYYNGNSFENDTTVTLHYFSGTSTTGDSYLDSVDFTNAPNWYHLENGLYDVRNRCLQLLGGSGIGHQDIIEFDLNNLLHQNSTYVNSSILTIYYAGYIQLTGVILLSLMQWWNYNTSRWDDISPLLVGYSLLGQYYNSSNNHVKFRMLALFSNYSVEALLSYAITLQVTWSEYHTEISDLDLAMLLLTSILPFLCISLIPAFALYEKTDKKPEVFFITFIFLTVACGVVNLIPLWLAVIASVIATLIMLIMGRK